MSGVKGIRHRNGVGANIALWDVDLPGKAFIMTFVQLPAVLPRSIGSVAIRIRNDVAMVNICRQGNVMAQLELKTS